MHILFLHLQFDNSSLYHLQAVVIQRQARIIVARKNVKFRQDAIRQLQALFRMRSEKIKFLNTLEKATKVQAVWRGFQRRKRMKNLIHVRSMLTEFSFHVKVMSKMKRNQERASLALVRFNAN